MTEQQQHEAGAHMDAEIHRRVFGEQIACSHGENCSDIPPYSTDIAAAMLVVERMRDLWTKYTEQQGDRPFRDWSPPPFHDGIFFESLQRHADRRWPWAFLYVTPLAICRAALAAVEDQP
jgi:hypothetical protein